MFLALNASPEFVRCAEAMVTVIISSLAIIGIIVLLSDDESDESEMKG